MGINFELSCDISLDFLRFKHNTRYNTPLNRASPQLIEVGASCPAALVKFAYIAAIDHYLKVEELPSGHGIADVVYLPKKRSRLPAMVIELKWNKTSKGAIDQIMDRNYPEILKEYGGDMILVGINYSEKTNVHTCRIERVCM